MLSQHGPVRSNPLYLFGLSVSLLQVTMRKLLLLLAIPAFGQLTLVEHTVSNPYKSPFDGANYTGTIELSTNCRMTRGGQPYASGKKTFCMGVTGSACDVSTAAGVISVQLVPVDAGTLPTGCSYVASHVPRKGSSFTDAWVPTAATPTTIDLIRTSLPPSPSAVFNLSQLRASGTGCLQIVNGQPTLTGLPCASANQVAMDTTTGHTTDCVTRTAIQHGFSSGGLVAWAIDEGTGEVLKPSVDTNIATTRTVVACFATGAAPAAWTLNIAGAPGSGLPRYTLLSGDETIPASTHGIYSGNQMWACFDSAGVEFECFPLVNQTTFAARIQHTPFAPGSFAVPLGR